MTDVKIQIPAVRHRFGKMCRMGVTIRFGTLTFKCHRGAGHQRKFYVDNCYYRCDVCDKVYRRGPYLTVQPQGKIGHH